MLPTHGAEPRRLNAAGEARPDSETGRFRRMFDPGPRLYQNEQILPARVLADIAHAMMKPRDAGVTLEADWTDENPTIPAGYTYFGQFLTHDLSFDPTPLSAAELQESIPRDFRTPALDLDCLYGLGPAGQPYLYTGLKIGDGRLLRLRTGVRMEAGVAPVCTQNDLVRLSDSSLRYNDDRDGVAVIGDPRNDQTRMVAQIHAALVAFHNRVVGDDALLNAFNSVLGAPPLAPYKPGPDNDAEEDRRFRTAVKLVRWHYQWVVVHDFLDRVCAPGVKEQMLSAGREPILRLYDRRQAEPYMPLEFAGAVFRFGHSMVRKSYALNKYIGSIGDRLPVFSHSTNSLAGFSELPPFWNIDWGFFLPGLQHKGQHLPDNERPPLQLPQPAYRIDAILSDPLDKLPEFKDQGPNYDNLAFRNLRRGEVLRLPSGEQVAQAMAELRIDATLDNGPLSDAALWTVGNERGRMPTFDTAAQEKAFATTGARRKAVREKWVDGNGVLKGNTPLWYYILREAEYYGHQRCSADRGIALGGQHLGPVGSRIVAETLLGLLYADRTSVLHAPPGWEPLNQIAGPTKKLTLARLFAYALT